MKKILKTIILGVISLFCSLFGQEVIFEHPYKFGTYDHFFDGRIIRTPKREKFICFKWEDSLVIFNINTKKITRKKYREIDSMIIGGRIISDSPFMGVFIRDRSGIIKDIFVLETEGGYKIIELPNTNIGFYYNYYKDDNVIEIIGGIDKLLRYEVHINNNEISIDKITEITSDSGGYNYVFGGENKYGEMIFSYPYFSTTRVVILRRKGESIEVEKRDPDPEALDIAVLGIKKYSMRGQGSIIFDIDDKNFYKIFENLAMNMITGTDEIALASPTTSWQYYREIVNLNNGEIRERLYYKSKWTVLDAVMMNDSIIVVGAYKDEGNTFGIVVMVKRLPTTYIEESKESKESKKIKVNKIGNTIEIRINSEVDEIVVYDVLGRIVKKEKESRMILTNLSTGVYFVVCRNKDKIFIEKIYIIK